MKNNDFMGDKDCAVLIIIILILAIYIRLFY